MQSSSADAMGQALADLARRSGRGGAEVRDEAERYLVELRSRRTRSGIGAFAALSRLICRRGYESAIVCDRTEFEQVAELSCRNPLVYLITHKTYLDIFALYHALHEQGIEPPYVFGGINMDFLGLGWLSRRAGGIFIRRGVRDNPVYRLALKYYIADLLSGGASFMWAIEGTRSRTGKLVMPKLGLLKYVVGASRQAGLDTVRYLPVSIAYDQIPDVPAMTAQQVASGKSPESLAWFLRYVRSLDQPLGRIYVRFGEPVSLHDTPDAPLLGADGEADEERIEVAKLAFEVCYRINRVTPPTVVSLVMMSLLCEPGVDRDRLLADVRQLYRRVIRNDPEAARGLPIDPGTDFDRSLAGLAATGMVEVRADGGLAIPRPRHLAALYYSNMAAHHLVITALTELALVRAAEVAGAASAEFWTEMERLRDLFKMEFFFARRPGFLLAVQRELGDRDPRWQAKLDGGRAAIGALLEALPFSVARAVLGPYVDAYRICIRALLRGAGDPDPGDAALVEECLELGRSMAERREIRWADSASRALLANGFLLARHRGLIGCGPEVERRRREFDVQLTDLSRRLDTLAGCPP